MMLHLSHLSTLASCYLDYVTHALAYRAALPELLEVLLDVGAVDDLPSDDEIVGDKSLVSFELFGYAQARAGLIRNQSRDVFEQLKAKVQFDYGRASLEDITRAPRVHLLLADAGLRQKEMVVPFPVLDVIASHYPRWRYAHRVRAACAAALAAQDDQPLAFTEKFLEQFGNEFRMWSSMRRYAAAGAPWTGKLLSRLAGEVAMLPHDWMAWASLGAALKTPERNGVAELEARAEAQCAFGPAN